MSKQYAELALDHGVTVFTDGELFAPEKSSSLGRTGKSALTGTLSSGENGAENAAASQILSAQQNLPPLSKNKGTYTSITDKAALHAFID